MPHSVRYFKTFMNHLLLDDIYNRTKQLKHIARKFMKKIDVDWLPVEDLKDNPLNRYSKWTGEVLKTNRESIEEKGILVPLIVKKDKTIVDGHNRKAVAELLGIQKVPCVIVPDFEDSTHEKQYIDIVQNARRQLSETDYTKIIEKDFGNLIYVDNRGKNKTGSLGEAGDVSAYIGKRLAIPRTIVHRIIQKIRDAKKFEKFKSGSGKSLKEEIEANWYKFETYSKLINQRSSIRRKVQASENELKEIADISYWKQVAKEKEK